MTILHNLSDVWTAMGIGGLVGLITLVVRRLQTIQSIFAFFHGIWVWLRNRSHSRHTIPERVVSSTYLGIGDSTQISGGNIGSAGRDFIGGDVSYQGWTWRQVSALMRRFEKMGKVESNQTQESSSKSRRKPTRRSNSESPLSLTYGDTALTIEESPQLDAINDDRSGSINRTDMLDVLAISPSKDRQMLEIDTKTTSLHQVDLQQQDVEAISKGANAPNRDQVMAVDSGAHLGSKEPVNEVSIFDIEAVTETEQNQPIGDQPVMQSTNNDQVGGVHNISNTNLEDSEEGPANTNNTGEEGWNMMNNVSNPAISQPAAKPIEDINVDSILEEVDTKPDVNEQSDDWPSVHETKNIANEDDFEKPAYLSNSPHHEIDDQRIFELGTSNPALDEVVTVELASNGMESGTEVTISQADKIDSDVLLAYILEDYSPTEIGSTLKNRRILVDIRQTDISYDRGWVEALEEGLLRKAGHVSDLSLLAKVQRYLYVVGWSPEAFYKQLTSQ